MDRIDRTLLTIGYLLLAVGVGSYIRLALTGKGEVLLSFACLMSCLFFFNWPTVRAKRRLRREEADQEQTGDDV